MNGRYVAKQRGFVDLNIGAMIVFLLVVGAIAGIAIYKLIAWLWPYLKAFLHQVTA